MYKIIVNWQLVQDIIINLVQDDDRQITQKVLYYSQSNGEAFIMSMHKMVISQNIWI